MAVEWVSITGKLTEEGEIIVDLPKGWIPGVVRVEITLKEGYLPPSKQDSDEPIPFDKEEDSDEQ